MSIVHLVNGLGFDGSGKVVMELCSLAETNANYQISVISLTPHIQLSKTQNWPVNVKVFPFDFKYDTDYSLGRYLRLYFNKKLTQGKSLDIIEYIEKNAPSTIWQGKTKR